MNLVWVIQYQQQQQWLIHSSIKMLKNGIDFFVFIDDAHKHTHTKKKEQQQECEI